MPLSLGAQQIRIPIRKEKPPRVDSVRVDTVWKTRVETLTVYREKDDLRQFFVHDTTRDTVTHHALIPLPIPIPLRSDCIATAVQNLPTSTTPEPATVVLVGSGMIGLWWKRRKRG